MVGKLKNEIRRFFDVRMEFILRKQQLAFDYMQISKLFKEEHFIPLSKWSLSPSVILHVLNDIFINKRKNIVEFGSGASTLYIAKLIKTYNLETSFHSVEADKEWHKKIKELLDFYELSNYVNLIHAPIVKVDKEIGAEEQESWYDKKVLAPVIEEITNFDLILVDGPVGEGVHMARYSAIPFLKEKLEADFSVFLDDTNRKDEKKIIKAWKVMLGCDAVQHDRYVVFSKSPGFDVKPMALFGN